MIGKRISTLSSNKEAFDTAIPEYRKVLKDNFYKENLIFDTECKKVKKKSKKVSFILPSPVLLVCKDQYRQTIFKIDQQTFWTK